MKPEDLTKIAEWIWNNKKPSNNGSVILSFAEIVALDCELSKELLHRPIRTLRLLECDLRQEYKIEHVSIRIKGLPNERVLSIGDIRSSFIGQLVAVDGFVKSLSRVSPAVDIARYGCEMCGRVIDVYADGAQLRPPRECTKDGTMDLFGNSGCGRRAGSTSFAFNSSLCTYSDRQNITIMEVPEGKKDINALDLDVIATGNLAGSLKLWSRVRVNGILSTVSSGGKSVIMDFSLYANSFEELEKSKGDVQFVGQQMERERGLPLRYDVLERDGFRCVICGRSAKDKLKLHVDHIVPICRGGESTMDNMRTLCEECNLGKGSKMPQPQDGV